MEEEEEGDEEEKEGEGVDGVDDGEEEVIAHAPMLDLGGLIKPGTIVRMTNCLNNRRR